MPPNEVSAAEGLLHRLLDRMEAPQQRQRAITQKLDYRTVATPAAQDEFHRVLRDAQRTGAIVLEAERMAHFTGEYARVRLQDAGKLYAFLARTPAGEIARSAQAAMATRISHLLSEAFFAQIASEAVSAWASNKEYLGFGPKDVDQLAIVLQLAHGIVHLSGRDVDHRTFSRRTVKDSKALERNEGRVARLLRRYDPALADEEPREILEASGIVRRAHLLQVKGPLHIESGSLTLRGAGEPFLGLPWAVAQQAAVAHHVDYVITIENPTSFWRFCSEIGGNYIALLTDGFPARDVLSAMTHVVQQACALGPTPLYHWGDIDAGGVRIAAHLEDTFGVPLRLHAMRPDLAVAFGSPLTSRTGLEKLSSRGGDIGALARWLKGDQGRALEQEELDPVAPPFSSI
ncbi:MAG TPA: Wadjet anti-phage system protein JetD domain-containing protein [Rhizomicrobium sp.]